MFRILALTFLFVFGGLEAAHAQSAGPAPCNAFTDVLKPTNGDQTIPVIPAALLANTKDVLFCLVRSIEALKPRVNSDVFDPETRRTFMSVSAALRGIISRAGEIDKAGKGNSETRTFISNFRSLDNLDVTWVLAYGVRNQDPDVRLNSLLILANVIDNTTLCVPLDHLFDKTLADTEYGKRGRANLLSVISVVAPWAYNKNYKNIERARDFVQGQISTADDLAGTNQILANITARLKSQTENMNKSVDLSPEESKACREFPLNPKWGKAQLSF